MNSISLLLVPVLLFPLLLAALLAFDALVKREYTTHPQDWEMDGRPHGFLWIPPESKTRNSSGVSTIRSSSTAARNRCLMVWIFSAPFWTHQDVQSLRITWLMRGLALAWFFSLLIPLVLVVTSLRS